MNNLKIFLISVLLVSSSNAFLMGTISNIISSGISTINGAILGGQFIWDNAINPSLQTLQENAADFIDNHFGNSLSLIGKRESKEEIKNSFLEQSNQYLSEIKKIFMNYVVQVKLQLAILYPSFVDSQAARTEAIKQLTEKTMADVQKLTETTIQNFRKQIVILSLCCLLFFVSDNVIFSIGK